MKPTSDTIRTVRRVLFGAGMFGVGAVAALVAANPAGAASALAAVRATVVCTTTGSTPCVGWANTSSGIAVLGTSVSGAAVRGASTKNSGVLGSSTNGYGVLGQTYQGPAGVTGTSPNGEGVYGYTSGSLGGIGVVGKSANGYGVYGTTTTGAGYGIVGVESGGGTGIYASSVTGYGLQSSSGTGGFAGVFTANDTGTALYAGADTGISLNAYNTSMNNPAILARSVSSNGGDFYGKYIGVVARAPARGYPLVLTNPSGTTNLVYIDGNGNISYTGGLFQIKTAANGATISAYTATSTEATVEDTGSAQLVNGTATVRFDPAFAASIESRTPYRVFVTPGGDTRGLFVTSKTPQGFVVREAQGGRSSASFDYRVVATSLGQTGKRMRAVDAATLRAPSARAPVVPAPPAPTDPRTMAAPIR